jgi:hypothetical protein
MTFSSGRFSLIGIFALIALFAVPDFVYAQPTLDRIQRRLEQKVNRKLDREVDKTIDHTVDKSVESAKGESKSKEKEDEFSDGVIFEAEEEQKPMEVKPNEFIGSFTMEVKDYNSNGKLKRNGHTTMRYVIDTWQIAISILDENGKEENRIIYHNKDNYMVTFTDLEKGEAMKMTPPKIKSSKVAESAAKYTFNKTGNTKEILGYVCHEYAYTSEDGSGKAWLSKELTGAMEAMINFSFMNQSKQQEGELLGEFADYGMWLENEFIHKNGDRSHSVMTQVEAGKIDPTIFDLSQYTVTDLSGMSPFGG